MAPIPLIGRLYIHEYLALIASFFLLTLESVARFVALLLPTPVIRLLYGVSRNAFNSLSSPYSRRARNRKKSVSSPIAQAQDFVELVELYGYHAEEHIVQTKDGYLLGLHRLAYRRGEEDQRVNSDESGEGCVRKTVVYLHHGLLMNSEVWVCLTEKQRCLPFTLVDQGYDVWLGNNRGNKYSKKSIHYAPTQVEFWNFSMDQFAFHDIPDSINYILTTTHQPSLSYIGFSQGTAQAFATLSIHPTLNSKIDVFVALAPAMAPPGIASGIVASLTKANPQVLFLFFGRRVLMGSVPMWQALLYPPILAWTIDKGVSWLFGWKTQNITPHQKLAAYPHLFSFTSVKSIVHWFQIIRNGTFQMYDDEVTTPLAVGNGSKYYKVAKFPTRNIKTPIVLLYGGSDCLVDIKLMLKELPKHTIAKGIQKYEHLDFLWASDVDKLVFPHVLDALESYASPDRAKKAALGWRGVERGILERGSLGSPNESLPPGYSEDEMHAITSGPSSINNAMLDFEATGHRPSAAEEQLDETDEDDEEDDNPETPFVPSSTVVSIPAKSARRSVRSPGSHISAPAGFTHTRQASAASTVVNSRRSRAGKVLSNSIPVVLSSPQGYSSEEGEEDVERTVTSGGRKRATRPEGWWSSTTNSTSESLPLDHDHQEQERRKITETFSSSPSPSAPPSTRTGVFSLFQDTPSRTPDTQTRKSPRGAESQRSSSSGSQIAGLVMPKAAASLGVGLDGSADARLVGGRGSGAGIQQGSGGSPGKGKKRVRKA